MLQPEIEKRIERIVKVLDEHKAQAIRAIDITQLSAVADCFLLASANSDTHLRACMQAVEEEMEKIGVTVRHIEGNSHSGWVLLDYHDFVLHLFEPESRQFYNLEKMWQDGEEIDCSVWIKEEEDAR